MGIFSSILGAVAKPLIGGLFDKKPEPQTTTINYKQMVTNARAAGFNPSSALRAGGSSGFTTTTPALSSRNFISEALQDGFSAALNYKQDQRDNEREALGLEVMKQDLANSKLYGQKLSRPPSVKLYSGRHESSNKTPRLSNIHHNTGSVINEPDRELVHKYIDVWDSDLNKVISILNPELTESGPLEMATGISTLAGAAEVQHRSVTSKVKSLNIANLAKNSSRDPSIYALRKLRLSQSRYTRPVTFPSLTTAPRYNSTLSSAF